MPVDDYIELNENVSVKGHVFVTEEKRERALLVGIDAPNSLWSLESSLEELGRLADTAGADAIITVSQKLDKPNPRTYIGSGKAEEIAQLCRDNQIDVVIFDEELSPSQQSNLEKVVGKSVKVIDRTALILDIFSLHATTKEGRLQVRLAQNQYLLPRLKGMWAHLASNRMGGGVGSRFGEGESQLEVDRRLVRKRITSIERELELLSKRRATQRSLRAKSGVFKVALAGYTNAGKSCLINLLTDAGVLSYDKLFATLDSTTRKLDLNNGKNITITDTVGFIQKLPTTLVEAFKSTLDEITGCDLILHVVDASSPEYYAQIEAVESILQQINADSIPKVMVFNKIDLLEETQKQNLIQSYPSSLLISALTGENILILQERIARAALNGDVHMRVMIPFIDSSKVPDAYNNCKIINVDYKEEGTILEMLVPSHMVSGFLRYQISEDN